jgi:hypothetical protein
MKSKFYLRLTMVFTAILMFAFAARAQTTVEVQVLYSEDDAEEVRIPVGGALGDVDLTSSDLELVFDSDPDYVGLRFRDVQIPKGATITEAYVQFTVDALVEGTTDVPIKLEVWGALEASAAEITGDPFSVSNRPFTTSMVPWEPGPSVAVGDAGENERTPDISAIIQEIIALEGWAPGNNMMIIVTTGDTLDLADKNREMESADGDAAGAPVLHVVYTEAAPQETTISVQVLYSEDDAEEVRIPVGGTLGDVDLTSSDLELVFDSDPDYVGMRFRDVQIPQGATITNAYVQFTVDALVEGTTDVPIKLEVWGALEASAAEITGDPFSVSNRPFTTNMVPWEPGPSVAVGDAGENEQTPDISAIIQEIVALEGWAAGNNMMIIVTTGDTLDTGDKNREMESADGDAAGAPVLNVTFTGGGGTGINSVPAEFSSLIYPNPTDGKLTIKNPSTDKFSYQIFTINGRLISSRQHITGATTELDLSGLAKGMYLINVRTTEKSESHKIILK